MINRTPSQVDSQESSRQQKKAEVLENLKRLYPGVVRREGRGGEGEGSGGEERGEEGGEVSCLTGVGHTLYLAQIQLVIHVALASDPPYTYTCSAHGIMCSRELLRASLLESSLSSSPSMVV